MDKLYIVIPAYNEAANLESVVRAWHQVAQTVGGGSRLLVVDDGSRDETPAILRRLQTELPRLLVHTKPNGGHGPAVRLGYRLALEGGADYVFQTDSDGPSGMAAAATPIRSAAGGTGGTARAVPWSVWACGWSCCAPSGRGSPTPTRPSA